MDTKPGDALQAKYVPPVPDSLEATGLSLGSLTNLAIKIMYLEGDILGYELAERMRLPHAGVVEDLLAFFRREQLCEVKGTAGSAGSRGLGSAVYRYNISDKGRGVAREAIERSQYAGPAPVPLGYYNDAIRSQPLGEAIVHRRGLERALEHLVLEESIIDYLGAAVNSRRSIFLFGPPGNGKTAISESVGRLVFQDRLYIPYAIETGSHIIKVFDELNHVLDDPAHGPEDGYDQRWLRIQRPVITVGGEMTLDELNLLYEPTNKYYEAPLQMKANGGMLLIDDFGRQQVRPRDLLNRWIVPLEQRVDYLALHTGLKIEFPFDALIVFATNLAPKDLVDEAFLRRIRHKIEVTDPSWDSYREIFRRVCEEKGVAYSEEGLTYLIKEHYIKHNRPRRGCHPRDLIDQVRDIATYQDIPPQLTKPIIDQACESYFVDL